jgi:ASC-1-like (ASCH) protein
MENQPKEWDMPLFQWAYIAIDEGKKLIEGRAPNFENPEKDYRAMKPGDVLKFYVVDTKDLSRVESFTDMKYKASFVHNYKTIERMLLAEGFKKMIPHANTLNEAVNTYHTFPGVPERVKKYGICAIGLGERII